MTIYTSAVQEQLIAELQNRQLTVLDFSRYTPEPQTPLTFSKHAGSILCVAALPNSQVVSGSSDHTLQVWNASTGECIKTFTGHTLSVRQIAVLPNSQVVSVSDDRTLRVWDIVTGKCLQILTNGYTHYMNTCFATLPNGQLVSDSSNKTLQVLDIKTGQFFMNPSMYHYHITCIAALPDGQIVIGLENGFLIKFQDVRIGQYSAPLEMRGHTTQVSCIAFLGNGQMISGSYDTTLRIWDISTGQCLKTLTQNKGPLACLAVLPNGQVVSVSHETNHTDTLKIWRDVSTSRCLNIMTWHTERIHSIVALSNNEVVVRSGGHLQRWALFPQHCYDKIVPVLHAISPECGLKHLSLQGVYLGQDGYNHLRQLVQSVTSLKTLDLIDTDLTMVQIHTLHQIVHQHRIQYQQLKAETQTTRDQMLQTQVKHFQEWEQHMQKLQTHYAEQERLTPLTAPEITFNCPIIELSYQLIENKAIPNEFLCPITRQVMWEPVMADDGYTYERDVIEAHIQKTLTSPMLPDQPLASQRVVLNRNVRAAIQRMLEGHPGWALYQPDAVYFSSAYEVAVQTSIAANDLSALLQAIDEEPRLLTHSLTPGVLIEQVWHKAELLEGVIKRLTPPMWSHLVQKEGSISNWLGKLAKLPLPSLASQLQRFTVFLQALQAGLSCEYPIEALIAQGLHQSLPALLLLGLNRLSGINARLDDQHNTALHYAAACGALSLVTALVRQGATITIKNKRGQTPRALAQLWGHDEVAVYCQKAKLQPLMSELLGNLGFLNICQHHELMERIEQQQATILQLQTQIQNQDQELQRLREICASGPACLQQLR